MPRASSRNRGGAGRSGGKASSAARARARDLDVIIVELAELIASGKWKPGETVNEIAAREGVKPHRVEEWAAEAGRFLRIGKDVEKRRALNLKRLDDTYETSKKCAKDRIAAVAEQNKMLGLHAPTKVSVNFEQYEQLDPQALHAKLIEQRRKLTETIDALEKQHPELVSEARRILDGAMKAVGIERLLGPLANCPHDPKHHSPAACAVERTRKTSSKPLGRIAGNANVATNRLLLDNVDDARNFRGGAWVAFAPTPDGQNLRTGRGIVHLIDGRDGWIQTDLGQWNTGVPAISVGDFIFEVSE